MRLIRVGGIALVAAIVAAGVSSLYYLTRPASGPQVGRGPLAQVGTQDGPQNAASQAKSSVVRIETGPARTPSATPAAVV